MSDRYGQILICVTEDPMGSVVLTPVSERRAKEIEKSNWYNGAFDVYLQDSQDIDRFMLDFPRATFRDYNGERVINDGVKILIDSWTYRHMVGGQSD